MAIFSSHTSMVQRSKGQNAVASAAYNSRDKLSYIFVDKEHNSPGEITWDYKDKEGLAYSNIFAPDEAPDWVHDREALWNKCEEIEKRNDAQTARKIMKALPVELTLEQNIELINEFAKEIVSLGMVVDVNIHNDAEHNPHAHLMLTLRELKEDRYGEINFSETKNREWGKRNFVNWHRELFANLTNKHLAKHGFDARVSHLSYKEQGIDLIPTKHVGPGMNITNSELVKNNLEILEENYQKILEKPTRILDKLTVNSPVFTKDQIAKELDKILSHKFMSSQKLSSGVAAGITHRTEGGKASAEQNEKEALENTSIKKETVIEENLKSQLPAKEMEKITKEYSAKFMELHNKIMNSPELSMVTQADLRGNSLYTTSKRLEMEERYLSTVSELHSKNSHGLGIKDLDELSPTIRETIKATGEGVRGDIKRGIEQMFGVKASFTDHELEIGHMSQSSLSSNSNISNKSNESNKLNGPNQSNQTNQPNQTNQSTKVNEISNEQRRAIFEILNGPNISILEGIPGAGKTVSMKEIVKQYKRAGKEVIGVAPSSAAALVLAKETGIEAKNASLWRKGWLEAREEKFDLFLKGDYYKEDRYKDLARENGPGNKQQRGGYSAVVSSLFNAGNGNNVLTKNHVMIIDEASMMELSNMDYMLSEASKVGAKVILVGDNNQLHAVGWMGAYKKAIDLCGTSKLEESRRQQKESHREATKLLGQFEVRKALQIYLDDKSIEIDRGELKCRSRLISEYIDSYLESANALENDNIATLRTQVISTYTNEASNKLNKEVRQQLKDAGVIKGREYNINVGDKKLSLSKGEQIVFTRNFNYLGASGIYNGEVGTILSVTKPDQYGDAYIAALVSKADGSKEAVIIDTKKLTEYGDARLLDYGYAVTAHKLQGSSVDNNFLFFEKNMGYESLNVLLTRHRENLRCFVNSEMLEEVAYESVGDMSKQGELLKAQLRYDISSEDQVLNSLVKLASKRVNTSFAIDYKDMGLSKEDIRLKEYIDKTHLSVEIIREISRWQAEEERVQGIKPSLWNHDKWDNFIEARNIRNGSAKIIVENFHDFKERIVQLGMNYETIRKHAGSYKSKIEETSSDIYKTEHYKNLVHAIDGMHYPKVVNSYKALKAEIADNYASLSELMNKKVHLEERYDELSFAIDQERNFREKLVPNYLSRIYKDDTDQVISKFKQLLSKQGSDKQSSHSTGAAVDEAAKLVAGLISKKPSLLGNLKGVGFGKVIGFGKERNDAIANAHNLEEKLVAYARSEKLEAEYTKELQSHNIEKELLLVQDTIKQQRQLIPSSLDEKFLGKLHANLLPTSKAASDMGDSEVESKKAPNKNKILALNDFKNSELFESIKLGIYRTSDTSQTLEDSKKQVGYTQKASTSTSYNRIEFEAVNAKLGSNIYESVFRDFANHINPDSDITKKNTYTISCGSLNMDLKTGLWHRFSSGEGGNIYDFVASGIGKGRKEALELLGDKVGIRKSNIDYSVSSGSSSLIKDNKSANQVIKHNIESNIKDEWVPYKNIPSDAPTFDSNKALAYLKDRGVFITNIYEYKSKDGALIGYTIRIMESRADKETGEIRQVKQVMPVAYCYNESKNRSRWQLKGFVDENGKKPIYNAHLLTEDPSKPVLIVEGEKSADAASRILPDYNVVSWMGGSSGVKRVDWSQLQGKDVIIWPDNDSPGIAAANQIVSAIDKANGFYGLAKIVDVESMTLSDKWDLADKLPDHLTYKEIESVLEENLTKGTSDLVLGFEQNQDTKHLQDPACLQDTKHLQEKNELLQAIDMLEKSGRVEFEPNIASKELYKDALVSIVLQPSRNTTKEPVNKFVEVSIEKSEKALNKETNLLDKIYDAQEKYLGLMREYDQIHPTKPNADRKEIILHNLARDAYISSKIALGRQEIVSFHHDLIKEAASKAASKMFRLNDSDIYGSGIKMHEIINSDEFANKVSTKNVALAKDAPQKEIELQQSNVDKALGEFEIHKSKSKTSSELIDIMKKENNYLVSLYKGMDKYEYNPQISSRINAAQKASHEGILEKLHKSSVFAQNNYLMKPEELHSKLKSTTDIHSTEKTITHECIKHNEKIVDTHLKQLREGYAVELCNKWIENPHQYMDHWKKNYDPHLIPMKTIEKEVEHYDHQIQKSYDLGGPRM